MSERFDPAEIVERDGDIISGADAASLEGNLVDSYDAAVRAAHGLLPDFPMIEGAFGAEPRFEFDSESGNENENDDGASIVTDSERPTPAEGAYDTAEAEVERRVDQGIDREAAWASVDPSSMIRSAYRQEQTDRQTAINMTAIDEIRQTIIDERRARVRANYPDGSDQQKRALDAFNARLIVEEQRRHEYS